MGQQDKLAGPRHTEPRAGGFCSGWLHLSRVSHPQSICYISQVQKTPKSPKLAQLQSAHLAAIWLTEPSGGNAPQLSTFKSYIFDVWFSHFVFPNPNISTSCRLLVGGVVFSIWLWLLNLWPTFDACVDGKKIILTCYSAKWPPAAFHMKNPKPSDHLYSEVIYSHERRGIQIRLCGTQTPCTPSRCVCVFFSSLWLIGAASQEVSGCSERGCRMGPIPMSTVRRDNKWDSHVPLRSTSGAQLSTLFVIWKFSTLLQTLTDRPRTHTYTCPVHTNACTVPNRSTWKNECAARPLFIGFFFWGFLKCQM